MQVLSPQMPCLNWCLLSAAEILDCTKATTLPSLHILHMVIFCFPLPYLSFFLFHLFLSFLMVFLPHCLTYFLSCQCKQLLVYFFSSHMHSLMSPPSSHPASWSFFQPFSSLCFILLLLFPLILFPSLSSFRFLVLRSIFFRYNLLPHHSSLLSDSFSHFAHLTSSLFHPIPEIYAPSCSCWCNLPLPLPPPLLPPTSILQYGLHCSGLNITDIQLISVLQLQDILMPRNALPKLLWIQDWAHSLGKNNPLRNAMAWDSACHLYQYRQNGGFPNDIQTTSVTFI